jgi:ketosteroid isomerase-like protein
VILPTVTTGSLPNESVLRRSIEAWNADDWNTLKSLWNPTGHIVAPDGWPEAGRRDGWDAMRQQWRRIKDSWTEERVELLAVRSLGDRLLADIRWTVRGEASGAALEVDMWMLCAFQEGRFTSLHYFLDHEAALAEAEGAEQ